MAAKKLLSNLNNLRSAAEADMWDAVSVVQHMESGAMLLRYTELLGLCEYQLWHNQLWHNHKVASRHMHEDQLPEWLQAIVMVGRMGEHFMVSIENPPTRVLWAELDEGKNLVRFVDHNLIKTQRWSR